jgi:hypothetical protein
MNKHETILRDSFAQAAMQALIRREHVRTFPMDRDELCAEAYRYADAMLKARVHVG